ncbi:Pyridoxamine 5'-phosphate oxidase [Pseudovibrio sp. Ad46]|uniref:pyridoxamine 5'-phosphate oxidase family protein n=1 Tax=Pseudovibrio sp. Ad46 TaxID=989432 RepID=UPI0007AECAF7|nr:pyridoxamine 5'-phosphate oxidase family protein [Pseudovibrio sp. Ad46]KZK88499.1 Pyridoxamine 5'-phosphate oxidase [Pseudovibrio sp. Ad46]
MPKAFAKIAFTPAAQSFQDRYGTKEAYATFLEGEELTGHQIEPDHAAFISRMDGFYLSTLSQTGWPYVQFKGGPRGFLKVLDDQHFAYADYRGNRQYLSAGNISQNARVSLILVDYETQQRLKIWGEAQITSLEEDREFVMDLMPESYKADPERAITIKTKALEWDCPRHIPKRASVAL